MQIFPNIPVKSPKQEDEYLSGPTMDSTLICLNASHGTMRRSDVIVSRSIPELHLRFLLQHEKIVWRPPSYTARSFWIYPFYTLTQFLVLCCRQYFPGQILSSSLWYKTKNTYACRPQFNTKISNLSRSHGSCWQEAQSEVLPRESSDWPR